MFAYIYKWSSLFFLFSLLAACGGGGGGNNSANQSGIYSISGTVSGLRGTLVLQNNGTDSLTITQNGAFSFDKLLNDGDWYDVDVSSQPTGQNCILSKASGLASDTINDISITCVDRPIVSYTIDGIVSGLNGTLVLQNSGGADMTLTTNGTFQIETQVFEGDSYHISISRQPSEGVCALYGGTGPKKGHTPELSIRCGEPRTIGGTVTGLNGTLVLYAEGIGNLTLEQNGAYTLPPMPINALYNVSVETQPNGQVCEVSNGYGEVPDNDVNNINITCSSYYTMGGTVSGLSDGQVSLYVNGSLAYIIGEEGNYTLGRYLEGTRYVVSLYYHSTTQQCNLSNGVGVMTGDVTDINISCIDLDRYTLSGTVSGLNGTLELLSSSGDAMTLHSDGDFDFINPIIEGVDYWVVVSTQPDGQICTVSNGVGTALSNVSITVVCGTPYSLGGVVSGLSGDLVLQNNGSDHLSIDSDGHFTFSTQVAQGSAYDVSVFNSPGHQQCHVANGSGTMTGDVADLQVTCTDLLTLAGSLGQGLPQDSAVQGGYAYVAADSGLLVLDISDPANMTEVAFYKTPVSISAVAVSGSYAYAAGRHGFMVLDISNPTTPAHIGVTNDGLRGGGVYDMVLNGSYAYISGGGFMAVIDVADPTAPTIIGDLPVSGWHHDLAVNGNYVYLADYLAGLHVIDINDPTAPAEVSLVGKSGIRAVTVSGNQAYVANGTTLNVYNLSNPASPALISSVSIVSVVNDIAVAGDHLYATAGIDLRVVDISNPASPVIISSHRDTNGNRFADIALEGEHAYLLPAPYSSTALVAFDISAPADPVLLGRSPINEGAFSLPTGVAVSGGYALIATSHVSRLSVVSVQDPSLPTYVESLPGVSGSNSLTVVGERSYTVNYDSLSIQDISNPAAPMDLGSVSLSSSTNLDVVVNGAYAFVAGGRNGVIITDISDPAQPTVLSRLSLGQQVGTLETAGSYVYASVKNGGDSPLIIDVSDPSTPREVGFIPANYVKHILFDNGYLYLSTGLGLQIFNASDPLHPVKVGAVNIEGSASYSVISGKYLYMACGSGGLRIVDISDPTAPFEVAHQTTAGDGRYVDVVGDMVYVAEHGYGLEIFQTFLP
jgi:hypothetical protein